MKKLKTGAFSATVDLETNHFYQFRYLLGNVDWENDPDADGQAPTPFGDSYNSVIKVLERHPNLSGRVIMVETVDKMTSKQIAARVRSFYEIRDVT